MKQPTKAIICAAGLGSRFLPVTKTIPKEMLPLVDKPVIQYIVEEAVKSGVKDIIIVTSSSKKSIEDHFDRSYSLEQELISSGKTKEASDLIRISNLANFIYIRQKGEPKGNARPILNARHLINDDEPFFVFFADDFFRTQEKPWPAQLLECYNKTSKSAISLVEVDIADSDKYGMASVGDSISENSFEIKTLVEKPGINNSPSNLASAGSYLLTPEIFEILEKEEIGVNGEITLADSINQLATTNKVYGCIIDGKWYDTGDQLKYIKTLIDIGLDSPIYRKELENYLKMKINS